MSTCPACLRRSWLLGRLAGHLDRVGDGVEQALALADDELIAAVGGRQADELRHELAALDPAALRAAGAAAGVEAVCGCDPAFPPALHQLAAPPAVLHVAGGLARFVSLAGRPAVAIVGARRASPYALDLARALARGAAARGATVVSGMARGVDLAAHEGALDAGGATIAVLAAAPERAYPPAARRTHRRILTTGGAAVSELGPGVRVRRWMFPARNRLVAALSQMTVVVAARPGSGALLTAGHARRLGRELGAVPGPATAPLSAGPHQLLREGARLVAGSEDILAALPDAGLLPGAEALPGAGGLPGAGPVMPRPSLEPGEARLLQALADGHDTAAALEHAGFDTGSGLTVLASLELSGLIRRHAGGRFSIVP